MALVFSALTHRYEDIVALRDVSFSAERGEITCLLGASGCGKTTLLNLTAGILNVQVGEIHLDSKLLANRDHNPPPEQRPVGLVFQDGALFPHMTVGQNVAFGLPSGSEATVASYLDQVGLAGFADRMPAQLSGGQQQRVALVRALATAPSVVLMDEPFANIDNQLRRSLREETRAMLRSSDATVILVTHDPEEAIEIADKLVIMEAGQVVQAGSPAQIYAEPASVSVAAMFGNGQVISAQVTEDGVETSFGSWPLACLRSSGQISGDVTLVVRPDALSLTSGDLQVSDRRSVGPYERVIVSAPDGTGLVVHQPLHSGTVPASHLGLEPKAGSLFAFPADAK